MGKIAYILGLFALILLIAPAYAIEVELIDTEFVIVNSSANTPNSTVLDVDTAPIQLDPSTICHITDAEFYVADATVSSPNSEVLNASNSPTQLDPSNRIYIIDTEFTVIDESELEEQKMAVVLEIVPVASFTHTVYGLTAYFNSTSYDPKGDSLQSYNWDFGDGKTSNTQNTTHIYSMGGNYLVTLIVTDLDGFKAVERHIISVNGGSIIRVIHPEDVLSGIAFTVEVFTNVETDITVSMDIFHQTIYGKHAIFSIDTATIDKGLCHLAVETWDSTYRGYIIIYDPQVYQSITKGIDDLDTYSKYELHEISNKSASTLTNHVYTLILGMGLEEDITVGDMLNHLRDNLEDTGNILTDEVERFKGYLMVIDPETSNCLDDMDSVLNFVTNVRNAILESRELTEDEKIVETVNRRVMKPALHYVLCSDKENLIDARTQSAKIDLYPSYPRDRAMKINEILSIGKEAIENTGEEEIFRLYIGDLFGYEISSKPTLDTFSERQKESLNPPWLLGKYNPLWLWDMTRVTADSVLTVPTAIGWMSEDSDEDGDIQIMIEPVSTVTVTVIVKAIKIYMAYADAIESVAPWAIDGGMVVSVDILAKDINEKHANAIDAVYDIAQVYHSAGVSVPMSVMGGLYVPEGNILVTTSPDGKIRDFKYVKSDSVVSVPKKRNIVSLNTGWFQSFDGESQEIRISIDADNFSYNAGDIVNLMVNIHSDVSIEDAMILVSVPEANTTIKDIFNVTVGNTIREYNFTIYNETWHVPRVYLANFGTILAENYTTLSVGSEISMRGLVMVDSDEFYDPDIVVFDVTVHNTGNTQLSSRLDYFGAHPELTGSIDISVLDVGEEATEQLAFELTSPGEYEVYFILNSSDDVLDYTVARFTVTAIDTLLAFPATDKPIYTLGEDVTVIVTVKNITLDVVEFPYVLSIMTPAGEVIDSELFIPEHSGTYMVNAEPVAEGYCVVDGETLFIVGRQSSLVIETETIGNITVITVKTDVGGAVEGADIIVNGYALKTDENGTVEFSSFNVTQLIIRAEKFGFNPDLVSVDLGVQVFSLSLNEGWNLISLPLQPDNTSVFSVFPPDEVDYVSVWTYYGDLWKRYDFESPFPHLNDLYDLEVGRGYWINMVDDDVVTIEGSLVEDTVHLTNGWNLVGYNALASQSVIDAMSSIEGNYTSVWQYDGGDWYRYDLDNPFPHLNDLHVMEPGYGYWINVNSTGCDWVV